MPIAHPLYLRAAETVSVAVGRDLDDSHIHAQKVIYHAGRRVWKVARRSKVELAAMVDKVGLALLRFQKLFLAWPGGVSDLEPSGGCPDAHCVRLEAENSAVVADGTVFSEATHGLLVQLVGVRDLGNHAHDDLSAERKLLAGDVVVERLQRVLAKYLVLPCLFADPVATGVRLLNGIEQRFALGRVRVQSYFRRKLQESKFITNPETVKTFSFPPTVNGGLLGDYR